jgi:1,4-alpha-glucan branching enzyme
MYDTELFGHWWFEGPTWLAAVLRELAADETVALTLPAAWVQEHPPREAAAIPESSWGTGGGHDTWSNRERMRDLAARHRSAATLPRPDARRVAALNQTARELLLLQSSDWPFLISTGQAAEYAALRFTEHAAKFNRLAFLADATTLSADDEALVAEAFAQDNVFPDIDYRDWAPPASNAPPPSAGS